MATKTFKVALSLDNPRLIQTGITVHSFDRNSVKISISLTMDSQAYKIPTNASIKISLFKMNRQEQKIIADVPNISVDSIDWIVPDYLDGYQGEVRVGVYLLNGTENVDLGYFNILSNVSDIDKMADEFIDNAFQGWEQIEADLNELNLTIAQANLDLNDILTTADSAIANINAKNTQVNTLHSDATSKYNAFDTSVTQANQTIDEILGLADDVAEKANKQQEDWITPTLMNTWTVPDGYKFQYRKNQFNQLEFKGGVVGGTTSIFTLPPGYRPSPLNGYVGFLTDVSPDKYVRVTIQTSNGSVYISSAVGGSVWFNNVHIPLN